MTRILALLFQGNLFFSVPQAKIMDFQQIVFERDLAEYYIRILEFLMLELSRIVKSDSYLYYKIL